MIKQLTLNNVRLFSDQDYNFTFNDLTVLCGTNSAGKSTVIKILLLIRQSLGIRESVAPSPGRLKYVGSQVDVGNFESFTSKNNIKNDLIIGVEIEDKIPIQYINFLQSYDKKSFNNNSKEFYPYILSTVFHFGIEEKSVTSHQHQDNSILKLAEFGIIVNNDKLLNWEVKYTPNSFDYANEQQYSLILPSVFFEKIGGKNKIIAEKASDEKIEVRTLMKGLLPEVLFGKEQDESDSKTQENKLWPISLPPVIREALYDFVETFRRIRYLAPLRSPAKRYYIAPYESTVDLDSVGDFLPYVLRDRKRDRIQNFLLSEEKTITQTVEDAVNYWIYYLRTGEIPSSKSAFNELKLKMTKGVLVEFQIKSNQRESYSLADSGFGYSQVLPIIVRGLLAKQGSILIVEQPELHLNPSLQVRLVDFFISMINLGKQIILETHSEHIVNALRVRIVENLNMSINDRIIITYLDMIENRVKICQLNVKSDGTIPEWPRAFFGEALDLSSRLLKAQKKLRNLDK